MYQSRRISWSSWGFFVNDNYFLQDAPFKRPKVRFHESILSNPILPNHFYIIWNVSPKKSRKWKTIKLKQQIDAEEKTVLFAQNKNPSWAEKRHQDGRLVRTSCLSPERFPGTVYCSQLLEALWINCANIAVVSRVIKLHCVLSVCGLIPTMAYWSQSWSKSTRRVFFSAQDLQWGINTWRGEKKKKKKQSLISQDGSRKLEWVAAFLSSLQWSLVSCSPDNNTVTWNVIFQF